MSERMADLKSCPFCGNELRLLSGFCNEPSAYWDGGLRGQEYGYVMCPVCSVILKEDTEDEAIKAWNRRATDGEIHRR